VPSNSPLSLFIQPASHYKQEQVYEIDLTDCEALKKTSTKNEISEKEEAT